MAQHFLYEHEMEGTHGTTLLTRHEMKGPNGTRFLI